MLIHVARDGKELGQFTTEELEIRITARAVVPTDFAWMEGMESWQPIVEVFKIEWPRHQPESSFAENQEIRKLTRPKLFFGGQTK